MSRIPKDLYARWYRQIWDDIPGASTRDHPAPYPVELATRLIRMFSFSGDTVLDPFLGTGTTTIAAMDTGRNSIGVEVDSAYLNLARKRVTHHTVSDMAEITIADACEMTTLTKRPLARVRAMAPASTSGGRSKRRAGLSMQSSPEHKAQVVQMTLAGSDY